MREAVVWRYMGLYVIIALTLLAVLMITLMVTPPTKWVTWLMGKKDNE